MTTEEELFVTLKAKVASLHRAGQWWDAKFDYICEEHPEWRAWQQKGLAFAHLQHHGYESHDCYDLLEKVHLAAVATLVKQGHWVKEKLKKPQAHITTKLVEALKETE